MIYNGKCAYSQLIKVKDKNCNEISIFIIIDIMRDFLIEWLCDTVNKMTNKMKTKYTVSKYIVSALILDCQYRGLKDADLRHFWASGATKYFSYMGISIRQEVLITKAS